MATQRIITDRRIHFIAAGGSLLIGDAVIVFSEPARVTVYAPEVTPIRLGDEINERDPKRLQDIASAQLTGPYRVDGVPGYIRDFADAAQAAECAHRDERLACVRDKYDNIVYRSQGGPA